MKTNQCLSLFELSCRIVPVHAELVCIGGNAKQYCRVDLQLRDGRRRPFGSHPVCGSVCQGEVDYVCIATCKIAIVMDEKIFPVDEESMTITV